MAKKKKTAGKTKKIRNIDQIWSSRGISAPENFLFGLIIAGALLFSFVCIQSARQLPTSFPTAKISSQKNIFEKKIRNIVSGYPIENMSPYISRKKKRVASFLIAIAKKESNWGRYAPKMAGRDCYNYWGYRGPENTTDSGYSCFDSPEHAVNVVSERISELIAQKIDTPKEMVAWKCGTTSCARRDRGAAKWIWDVGLYYNKIYFPSKISETKQKQTAMGPNMPLQN